jgi:hypothetical protein
MTAQSDLYYEGFQEWMRARTKTHPDMKYWTDDEEAVAEFAWCEAWDNAEKWADEEIKSLKARIKKLEEECAWLNSVGIAGQSTNQQLTSYLYRPGPCSAHGSSGGSTDD